MIEPSPEELAKRLAAYNDRHAAERNRVAVEIPPAPPMPEPRYCMTFWDRHELDVEKKRVKAAIRSRHRNVVFNTPISTADIIEFTTHLIAVSFAPGHECWIYISFGREKGAGFPEYPKFSTKGYGSFNLRGALVGSHQFTCAVSEGILLADLAGHEVHHTTELGHCLGSRCCNPEHAILVPKKKHWSMKKEVTEVDPRHYAMVENMFRAAPVDRFTADQLALKSSRAGRRRRVLGGVPFLIREYHLDIPADGVRVEDQLARWSTV